jgi:CAAX prenyl protease-like protein
MNTAVLCRIAPFALYMTFIALEEALRILGGKGLIAVPDPYLLCLYPVKVLSVALVLFLFRKNYTEICFRELFGPLVSICALAAGIGVFVLWINLDQPFATLGTLRGFDPNLFRGEGMRLFLIASRLAGAVLVVPVMEELFWRSFLIRYIISPDFSRVAIGRFTWPSFLITAVLFGLEHNLFLAGILAGISYNLILYYTKSLIQCILAHAVTNLILGIYVLNSGRWEFW